MYLNNRCALCNKIVYGKLNACVCMCPHHAANHKDSHGSTGGKGGETRHHGDHELLLRHGALWEWRHAGADWSQGHGPGDLQENTVTADPNNVSMKQD